jgi:hypothetical protein
MTYLHLSSKCRYSIALDAFDGKKINITNVFNVVCADVMFCSYTYQRYNYPKQINELGVSGESLSQQISNAALDNTATNTESMDTQDTDATEASDKKND